MTTTPRVGQAVSALRGVRTADGEPVDLYIDDAGLITELRPASPAPASPAPAAVEPAAVDELTLTDWLVLPSAVEPHAHLDKALSWAATRAPYGDLLSAIEAWRHYVQTMTEEDVGRRARRALGMYLAAGFTAVRSHVDLLHDTEDPLRGVRAMLDLRDDLRDVLDLQICLLASYLVPDKLIEEALDLGVDVLGGCAHLAEDPAHETTRLLDIAQRRDLPVDLHTDEQLDPTMLSIRELAREVSARGMRQVTASHCVSLGSLGTETLSEVLDEVRAAGLAVVTLPITNLYLQGWQSPSPMPRGLPAVRELIAAGITVAAGGDNLRDPFNPVGRADPFETTSLLVTAAHLDARQALHAVTDAGREVLGLPAAGVRPGEVADLVAVRADDLLDAVAGPSGSRVVLRRGRVVASTSVDQRTAVDPGPVPTRRTA